jgi:rod shape-determining protein MreC
MLLALLWVGHGAWVIRSRPTVRWVGAKTAAMTHPLLGLSGKWEAWRARKERDQGDLSDARNQLRGVQAEVERLRLQQAQDGPLLSEAREAIRLLGLKQQLPLDLKAARILANLRQAPFGGYVVDLGADGALIQDQGVIAPDGVVGRIWQVGSHQSTVLPLDAFNASTSVMLGRSRATGVLQGTSRGRAEIRYISTQEIVQPGELVYTSGMDGVFPRGLLVGTVERVKPRDIELGVEVVLAAPLDKIQLVLVLPPQPPLELQLPAQPPSPAHPGGGSP